MKLFAANLAVLFLNASLVAGYGNAVPILKELPARPTLDGDIRTEEWKAAHYLGKFGDGTAPATEAWLGYHDDKVFVAVRCEEPTPQAIKRQVIADEKDAPVWNDDSVDFYLDPGNTGKSVYRILCNTEGTVYDSVGDAEKSSAAWDSGVITKVKLLADAWQVEMEIPMPALRHPFTKGQVIAVNVGRWRYASGKRQFTALSGPKVWPFGQFARLLVEGKATHGVLDITSIHSGPFFRGTPGQWVFEVENRGQPAELEIAFPKAPQEKPRRHQVATGTQNITLDVSGQETDAKSHCRISLNGTVLYDSVWQPADLDRSVAVPKITNPLFEPLAEPLPNGLSREGHLIWPHTLKGPPDPTVFALRAGMPYSREEVIANTIKENGIFVGYLRDLERDLAQTIRSHRGKAVLWPARAPAFKPGGAPVSSDKKHRWLFHPLVEQEFLADLDRIIAFAKENEAVWGIFAGDELWTVALRSLGHFVEQGESVYPWLKEVDEEIKSRFGYGKFGLPKSANDTNPYRWIATYRWVCDKLISVQQKVRDRVQKECPRLKIVSWDNQDGHFPFHLSQWKPLFDVVTGQLYPTRNPNRDSCGFGTRLMKDLTRIEEVWPLPHFEHYSANFTPEQTLDLLSQAFQGGATGLHLYLSDTRGRRRGHGAYPSDEIGAPDRWNVVRSILKHLPMRAKQLPADTALFYSNPSYQAQGGHRPKTFEIEWLYNILGPKLRGAIEFIDDFQAIAEKDQLSRFKSIYVAHAPIVDDGEFDALIGYARNGGTLVLCDPHAFRNRTDSTARDLAELNESLKRGTPLPAPKGRTVTRAPFGKGQLIVFDQNPLSLPTVIGDAEWIAFFGTLQAAQQAVQDNPVWRFRFPMPEEPTPIRPGGVCLTGNYVEWRQSEPQRVANATTGGVYRLSNAVGNEPAETDIPFAEGRLTDRLKAIQLPNNEADINRFALKWKSRQPLQITYRFDQAASPTMLRLFHQGALPAGECEVSTDGQTWQSVANWQETGASKAVTLLEVPLQKAPAGRYLRVSFQPAGKPVVLAETEIWGSSPSTP